MNFEDAYTSIEDRYSLGVESTSGRFYTSIPVSNGVVDYEEYYELSDDRYREFLQHPSAAIEFVYGCRRRERDALLMQRPGSNRGVAT